MNKTIRETIWKYPLEWIYEQTIEIPKHATILHFALQDNVPTLWIKVNTTNSKVECKIWMHETGGELTNLPFTSKFLGTVISTKAKYVGHFFYRIYEE